MRESAKDEIEVTPEMIGAGAEVILSNYGGLDLNYDPSTVAAEVFRAMLAVSPTLTTPRPNDSLRILRGLISTRLNNHLCEMQEGMDDSIVGFNEAWDIVRAAFAEALGEP